MREISGDIWTQHADGAWIVITTNNARRRDGACVMGRGIAKQAAQKFPDLPAELGQAIRDHGNGVHIFPKYRLIAFPVKHHWRELASMDLITRSTHQLLSATASYAQFQGSTLRFPVYMVRPGCGNGGLRWESVRPILAMRLDERFVVVERAS